MADIGLCAPAALQCPIISAVRLSDTQKSCIREGSFAPVENYGSYDGKCSPVPHMTNLKKAVDNPAANDIQVQNAEVAGNIVAHVDDLLGALSEMQGVNNYWKSKYMQCRSDHINKYVPSAASRGAEKAFVFWKNYVFQMGNVERLQRLKLEIEENMEQNREHMEDAEEEHRVSVEQMSFHHMQALDTLNRKLEEQNQRCSEVSREREYLKHRDDMSKELLGAINKLFEATPERTYEVANDAAVSENYENLEYTMQRLHHILNDVDPKYVPPVGSLCVPTNNGVVTRVLQQAPMGFGVQLPNVFPRAGWFGQKE